MDRLKPFSAPVLEGKEEEDPLGEDKPDPDNERDEPEEVIDISAKRGDILRKITLHCHFLA